MDPTHPGTRFRIRWVAETASTNSDVAAAAAAGEPEGLVIAADHQTAGRGRLGRTWTAPPGSALLCSFLLRPPAERVHLAVTAVGCAGAAACLRVAGVEPGLKWPNDLVIEVGGGGRAPDLNAGEPTETGGSWRKLAGILAEAVSDGGLVAGVVVGLGLNVIRPPDFPAELHGIATSLDRVSRGGGVDRGDLLEAICEELEDRCQLLVDRPADLMAEYRRRCVTIGRDVRVEQTGETWEGRATGVADDGSLEVMTAGGARQVQAGDVLHLRART